MELSFTSSQNDIIILSYLSHRVKDSESALGSRNILNIKKDTQ